MDGILRIVGGWDVDVVCMWALEGVAVVTDFNFFSFNR